MGWEVVVYFWDSRRDVGVGWVRDGLGSRCLLLGQ